MAGYKPQVNAHAGLELRNRNSSQDISDTVNGWFFGVTGSWAGFRRFLDVRTREAGARASRAKQGEL